MDSAQKPSVESIVRQALELPRDEQQRVSQVLAALAGVSDGGAATAPVAALPESRPELTVDEWLEDIQSLPPWDRLRLMDDALARTEPGEDTDAVQRSRQLLLDNNPPLAVRASVTRLIEQHPMMAGLGVLGLCFGVAALGKRLFYLIF